MATEQASAVTTGSVSLAKWASWLAGLVGLWVLASPFVLSGPISGGTPMWSNAVAGFVVLVLAAFTAYTIMASTETAANSVGEWSGWIAALAGFWILASPVIWDGSIEAGAAMWSNVIAGGVALVLAAYAGYDLHSG